MFRTPCTKKVVVVPVEFSSIVRRMKLYTSARKPITYIVYTCVRKVTNEIHSYLLVTTDVQDIQNNNFVAFDIFKTAPKFNLKVNLYEIITT